MFVVFWFVMFLLLVIWLGLAVIGLVFVVGWERGVVGNVVLDGLFFFITVGGDGTKLARECSPSFSNDQ